MAGIGGTRRKTRLIGRERPMDMHETARIIASHSGPPFPSSMSPGGRTEETPLSEGLLFERRVFHSLFIRPDQFEGMAAFLQKRTPESGRD